MSPGPGAHNPHDSLPKLKLNPLKPEQWITKHKEEGKKRYSSISPPKPIDPLHVDYNSFD